MRAALVGSCVLGAALVLAGCSGGPAEEPDSAPASSSAAAVESVESTTPAPVTPTTSAAPADVSAPTREELEARIVSLTDALGNPFQVVSAEDAAAGMEIVTEAMAGADVQPAECKDHATGNVAATGDLAAEAVSGVGAADDAGGYLAVVLLDGSTEDAIQQGFDVNRQVLEKCAQLTATIQGNTITSTTEELALHPVGEESFALRVTQILGSQPVFHNLSVTARGNGVIVNVQALSRTGLDGISQDQLADLAAQLLEPAGT